MDRETSVYLDLVRLSAACAVFINHVSGMRMTGGFLWQLAGFAGQAVTVFFVLSGYVIAYVVETREANARSYAVSRVARVYSVALPALVLTFLFDAMGLAIDPAAYVGDWPFHTDGRLWQFTSGLFFIHEVWFLAETQGSNLAYWSLGFEVWYYFIFGLMLFTRRKLLWTGLAMLAAGPAILSSFPLWLLGVAAYRVTRRRRIGKALGLLLLIGSITAWIAYQFFAARYGRPLLGWPPLWLRRPELVEDYLIGVIFTANLIGFAAAAPLFAGLLRPLEPALRWAAGATFTLYLMHLPIAQLLLAISPWEVESWANRALILLGTLLVVFLLAEVTERRKQVWRQWVAWLLQRLLPEPMSTATPKR